MTHPEILRAEKFGSLYEEGVIFCSVCGEEILDGFECDFMADGRVVCGECAERDEEGLIFGRVDSGVE